MTTTEIKTRPIENTITRRKMLHSLAASTVVTTLSLVPVKAGAIQADQNADTPIMKLFREWNGAHYRVSEARLSDAELDVICDHINDVGAQILALPPENAQDFAAKLVSYTAYGDFGLDSNEGGSRLLLDAASLLGDEPYQIMNEHLRKEAIWAKERAVEANAPVASSPPLEWLIDQHRSLQEALNQSCDPADIRSDNYGGPDAEELRGRLMAEEIEAFNAILLFPASSSAERKIKGQYLVEAEIDPTGGYFEQLLASFVA